MKTDGTLITHAAFTSTIAAGMSLVGGGTDVVIARSAKGVGSKAGVEKMTPGTLTAGVIGGPTIEAWREIR